MQRIGGDINNSRELYTERLKIIPVSLEYAKEINEGLSSRVTKYMFPQPHPLSETIKWIEGSIKKYKAGTDFAVVILSKNTGEFLGGGGIHHIDTKAPEFGIWIKESSHGNHYGREAVTALKKWADENLDYDYLLYPVSPENIPSCKIAESLNGKVCRHYEEKRPDQTVLKLVDYKINKL